MNAAVSRVSYFCSFRWRGTSGLAVATASDQQRMRFVVIRIHNFHEVATHFSHSFPVEGYDVFSLKFSVLVRFARKFLFAARREQHGLPHEDVQAGTDGNHTVFHRASIYLYMYVRL